ncbi:MAG: RNA polymerase sigma factor [Myxococcales bacterium]|nr:RNA polymerase sigma factor [Myxococcales bacterium]
MRRDHAPSAAALMTSYCAGDASAFRALHTLVAPRVLAYLVKMTRDRVLAADLAQQTFMKIHRARHHYIAGADPLPWIMSIAHHTFIDEVRKRGSSVVVLSSTPSLPEPATEHAPVDRARVDAALAALAELPSRQRQAVVLITLEGHSAAEAAQIAGTTAGTMRVRAHRGCEALRTALGAT